MKTAHLAFKDGVRLRAACFAPHMVRLLTVLLSVAPDTRDGCMVVTEAWRKPRHPDDAHTWCNAFDIRSRNVIHEGSLEPAMLAWASRAKASLDSPDWQIVVHGEGPGLHMHAEFDPR